MSLVKHLLEPGILILTFTIGTLVNEHGTFDELFRRRTFNNSRHSVSTGRRHDGRNQTVGLLARFPFLLEIVYWNLTYWPYQLARALSARVLASTANRYNVYHIAESNAMAILDVEEFFHMAVEQPTQYHILAMAPCLQLPMRLIYTSHVLFGTAFLTYAYTYFPRPAFQRIRRTLFIDNWIAFALLSFYRCAPPRMLPANFGFIDVMHPRLSSGEGDPFSWSNNGYQLTIASMPSLNFGTSVLIGWSMYRYSPHKLCRCLGPAWPAVMLLSVIGTANNFLLDCIAGAVVVGIGWRLQRLVLIFMPFEWILLWLLGMERPRSADVRARGHLRSMSWELSEEARHVEEAKALLGAGTDSEQST